MNFRQSIFVMILVLVVSVISTFIIPWGKNRVLFALIIAVVTVFFVV